MCYHCLTGELILGWEGAISHLNFLPLPSCRSWNTILLELSDQLVVVCFQLVASHHALWKRRTQLLPPGFAANTCADLLFPKCLNLEDSRFLAGIVFYLLKKIWECLWLDIDTMGTFGFLTLWMLKLHKVVPMLDGSACFSGAFSHSCCVKWKVINF